MKEHFAELRNFITFSVTRQITELQAGTKLILAEILARLPARNA